MGWWQKYRAQRNWKAATPSPGERLPLPNRTYGSFITGFDSFAGLRAEMQPISPSEANEGRDNSIVSICLNWIATSWPVAPPQVGVMDGSKFVPDKTRHPFLDILAQPGPETDYVQLVWALNTDWWRKGNAYGHLIRSRRGELIGIDWLPCRYMRPIPDMTTGRLLYYEYNPNGELIAIPPSDLIHLKYGIDEENPLQGVSPLAAQWREIVTDNRYSNYAAGMAGNGTPATVFTPKAVDTPNGKVTPKLDGKEAASLAEKIREKFRRKPGEAIVIPGSLEMHRMGVEPDKMAINEVRAMPETRIPAAFGIPPIVIYLWTGLQKNTYNNGDAAIKQAWRGCLIPTQEVFAHGYRKALRMYGATEAGKFVHHDWAQVPELGEDMSKKREDARKDHEAGLVTLEEARAEGGRQTSPAVRAQLAKERQERPATVPGGAAPGQQQPGQPAGGRENRTDPDDDAEDD